jgi:hypothetical protein
MEATEKIDLIEILKAFLARFGSRGWTCSLGELRLSFKQFKDCIAFYKSSPAEGILMTDTHIKSGLKPLSFFR